MVERAMGQVLSSEEYDAKYKDSSLRGMGRELEVYKSIAKITLEMSKEGIAKDKQGNGYKFRGIDDVYNALSPKLGENGLCVLPRVISRDCVERTTNNGKALFYITLDMEFDFVSSIDGSKHTVRTYGEAMDMSDKATNKAMSAAYKYACFQAFCIPTEGDNDTENNTHEVIKTTRTKTAVAKDFKALVFSLGKAGTMNELKSVWDESTDFIKELKSEWPENYASLEAEKDKQKERISKTPEPEAVDIENQAEKFINQIADTTNEKACDDVYRESLKILMKNDADNELIRALEESRNLRMTSFNK